MNTFSPEGRLWQLEYAMQAIKVGIAQCWIESVAIEILPFEKRRSNPLLCSLDPLSLEYNLLKESFWSPRSA